MQPFFTHFEGLLEAKKGLSGSISAIGPDSAVRRRSARETKPDRLDDWLSVQSAYTVHISCSYFRLRRLAKVTE